MNSYRKRSTKVKLLNACTKLFLDEVIISAKVALYNEYNAVLGIAPRQLGSKLKDKSENKSQTGINIANATRINIYKQVNDINELKNKIESNKMPTYATAFKSGLSNARDVIPQPNLNGMSSTARRPSTGASTARSPNTNVMLKDWILASSRPLKFKA